MNYIGLQEFTPKESGHRGLCIWCGLDGKKNRAHIITKKLTLTSHSQAILKQCVCEVCNNKQGKTEEWVLRNTPIGWIKLFLYFQPNSKSDTRLLPSYFFDSKQNEWIVFYWEALGRKRCIQPQLILSKNDGMLLGITEDVGSNPDDVFAEMMTKIHSSEYIVDVRMELPMTFSSRFLLESGKVILIASSKIDAESLIALKNPPMIRPKSRKRVQVESGEASFVHFKWSKVNWAKVCAKIAFEFLCLCEGAEFCLQETFDQIRKFVSLGPDPSYRELIFNENGPVRTSDAPNGIYLDLTNAQETTEINEAIVGHCEPGMHLVVIYEVLGYIYASVSLAGLPPSIFVLGGPKIHLKSLYKIIYDETEDNFGFFQLAYDRDLPMVPLPIHGKTMNGILETYGLHGMDGKEL